jgi:hypothetical protein
MKKTIGILITVVALTAVLFAQDDTRRIRSSKEIRIETQKPDFQLVISRESTEKTSDTGMIMVQIFKKSNKMLTQ